MADLKKSKFDPFADRLARHIRNDLSTAMVEGLQHLDANYFKKAAEAYLNENLPDAHRHYIMERLDRYEDVLATIKQRRIRDPFAQSVILWNRGLLFEVHERLEKHWKDTPLATRRAIKGIIQAAAAYLHLQCGHQKASRRLAQKAVDLLQQYGNALPGVFNYESIIAWLQRPNLEPPPML